MTHQQAVKRRNDKEIRQKQQFLEASASNIPDKFTFDLANALISANIPFAKIENEAFKLFLERETSNHVPRA